MDLNSVALVKMVMLVQILMKIIVTKAIFGLVMGIVSMVLSKVAILPLLSSYANKNNIHSHSAVATTNALLRQGANPSISANPLMTDNYNFYYSAMPGGRVRLNTSSGGSIYDSEISSLGYISPTASPINNENTSSESKHSPYKPQNYNFKHIARKEKYRNLNRRRVAATPRKIAPASYPETATSERSIGENMVRPILTTVVTTMFNELEKNGMFEDNVQSIQCCQRSITSHSRKFINYNAP